jgi:hypothetical protein
MTLLPILILAVSGMAITNIEANAGIEDGKGRGDVGDTDLVTEDESSPLNGNALIQLKTLQLSDYAAVGPQGTSETEATDLGKADT